VGTGLDSRHWEFAEPCLGACERQLTLTDGLLVILSRTTIRNQTGPMSRWKEISSGW
jgi:hypothetical protein